MAHASVRGSRSHRDADEPMSYGVAVIGLVIGSAALVLFCW